MPGGGRGGVHKEFKLLIVGLIIGCFSIFLASSGRDLLDSFIQLVIPVSDRAISGGGYLFAWRVCYFLLIVALLVIASICLV